MSKVVLDMSMSLDGFATAAGQTAAEPMGPGGLKLVEWSINAEDAVSRELIERSVVGVGAIIVGRRTYDTSLPWWGENGPTGDADMPVFVLTHTETAAHGVYRFVTDGPEGVVAQAKATAGDRTVAVSGAAAGQALLSAGLLDEISVHVVPVLFGSGTRLFDDLGGEHVALTRLEVVDAPTATHMRFRVDRDQAAAT